MASLKNIITFCLLMVSIFDVIVGAGKDSYLKMLEPVLAAGLLTMVLKKKHGHGYVGRAQSYEGKQAAGQGHDEEEPRLGHTNEGRGYSGSAQNYEQDYRNRAPYEPPQHHFSQERFRHREMFPFPPNVDPDFMRMGHSFGPMGSMGSMGSMGPMRHMI